MDLSGLCVVAAGGVGGVAGVAGGGGSSVGEQKTMTRFLEKLTIYTCPMLF